MPAEAIYAIVLLAAVSHAVWNALVKASADPLITLALIRLVGLVTGLSLLAAVPAPGPASWAYLAAAVLAHYAYYSFMLAGYRAGDLSRVYPIARGVAPLVVTGLAAWLAAEPLAPGQTAAVLLTSAGILLLAFERGAPQRAAAWFALGMGLSIAGYTFLNGMGVRGAGTVLGYFAWLEIGTGAGVVAFTVVRRPNWRAAAARAGIARGLAGGVLSAGGYLIGLWAISLLPMGPVTAMRETSVVFGALIGVLVLGEPLGRRRIAAAILVAAGIAILALLAG
ncbi:MAG: EamA family transporter [Xanthomonadales bacterium]|nr:EamA family transporter [Xanthomonadales bacterium]